MKRRKPPVKVDAEYLEMARAAKEELEGEKGHAWIFADPNQWLHDKDFHVFYVPAISRSNRHVLTIIRITEEFARNSCVFQ